MHSTRQLTAIRRLLLGPLYDKCNQQGIEESELALQLEQLQASGCVKDCTLEELKQVCRLKEGERGELPACYQSSDRQCVEQVRATQLQAEPQTETKMKDWSRAYNIAKSQEFLPDVEDEEEEQEEHECVICKASELYTSSTDPNTGVTTYSVVEGAVPIQQRCGHFMHQECINKLQAAVCPMCRAVLTDIPLIDRLQRKYMLFRQIYGDEDGNIYNWLNFASNDPQQFNMSATSEEVRQLFEQSPAVYQSYNFREIGKLLGRNLTLDMNQYNTNAKRVKAMASTLFEKYDFISSAVDISDNTAFTSLLRTNSGRLIDVVTQVTAMLSSNQVTLDITTAFMLIWFMLTHQARISEWYPYIYTAVLNVPSYEEAVANISVFQKYCVRVMMYILVAVWFESIGQRVIEGGDFDSHISQLFDKMKPFQIAQMDAFASSIKMIIFEIFYKLWGQTLLWVAFMKEYAAWMKVLTSVNPPSTFTALMAGGIAEQFFPAELKAVLMDWNQQYLNQGQLPWVISPTVPQTAFISASTLLTDIPIPPELNSYTEGILSSSIIKDKIRFIYPEATTPEQPSRTRPSRFGLRRPTRPSDTEQQPASKRRLDYR